MLSTAVKISRHWSMYCMSATAISTNTGWPVHMCQSHSTHTGLITHHVKMATWSSLKVVATAQDTCSAASRSQYCSIASVRVWHKHTYLGCRSGLHEKTPPSFINLHVDINRGAIHLHLHLRRHTYRTLSPHILSFPPHLPTPLSITSSYWELLLWKQRRTTFPDAFSSMTSEGNPYHPDQGYKV